MFDTDLIPVYVAIVLLLGVLGFCVYGFLQERSEVDRCFMQEPRTKECELVLYKYENRTKHTTTVMPMPMVIAR